MINMENNNEKMEIVEIDNTEVMEGTVVEDGKTDISTGVAVLIGAVTTAAVVGAVKLGRKVIGKIKAKKEAAKNEAEIPEVTDDDTEE